MCVSACGTWPAARTSAARVTPWSCGDLRQAAHRIADFIYEKLTGDKGVFSTRIAYVTQAGQRYSLWVADADGENAQSALSSPEPIISPAWSPNGLQLAYVSFESRKPVVYAHDVASGRRRLLANFRGSNSAPAWSPDGRTLAVTLSRDGGSQLYTMDANGRRAAPPVAVGQHRHRAGLRAGWPQMYFVSDRGGSPQIYRMPPSGGNAERVTFNGTYNISPSVSPDGKLAGLHFAHRWRLQAACDGPGPAARPRPSPTPRPTRARAFRPTAG
jgi:TolB protein